VRLLAAITLFLINPICFANNQKVDQTQKSVRFTIVESWPEPYAFFDFERNLKGGALKEVVDELGKRMNVRVEHIHLSRNRVDAAIEKGTADVRCYVNEAWTTKPDLYFFTQPLFLTSNSIIWKKGSTPLNKMADIEGKTIGTVAGYAYKTADEIFKSGKAIRSDVANEGMNITLLQKNRIKYAIVETTSFNWSAQKKNEHDLKDIDSFQIDSIPVKCGVLKKNEELFRSVESAIDKMKQDGMMKAISLKYNLK